MRTTKMTQKILGYYPYILAELKPSGDEVVLSLEAGGLWGEDEGEDPPRTTEEFIEVFEDLIEMMRGDSE